MAVRQTACRHCGIDIENFHPYRAGEWRDRGGNPTGDTREQCPRCYGCGYQPEGRACPRCNGSGEITRTHTHAPVRHRDVFTGSTSNAINF
jgi:RecJ-like exonuclease